MHVLVFRIGLIALLLMLTIMISVEAAAEFGSVARTNNSVQLWLKVATLLLCIAVIAGFVLYPQAWRLYRERKPAMDPERRHFWFLVLVFGLPIAGYAAHMYLRDKSGSPRGRRSSMRDAE
jgi:heme/copper-type cytochrome/quinol oxidase subunit 2